jgi:hypothetical protein
MEIESTLRSAPRIDATLVNYYGPGTQVAGLDSGYHATSASVPVDRGKSDSLTTVLLDRRSYQVEVYPCTFDPDVDFRFMTEDDTVHALLCLGCTQLVYYRSGKVAGGSFMTRVARQLEDLSYALFPSDSVVAMRWRRGRDREASRRKQSP